MEAEGVWTFQKQKQRAPQSAEYIFTASVYAEMRDAKTPEELAKHVNAAMSLIAHATEDAAVVSNVKQRVALVNLLNNLAGILEVRSAMPEWLEHFRTTNRVFYNAVSRCSTTPSLVWTLVAGATP